MKVTATASATKDTENTKNGFRLLRQRQRQRHGLKGIDQGHEGRRALCGSVMAVGYGDTVALCPWSELHLGPLKSMAMIGFRGSGGKEFALLPGTSQHSLACPELCRRDELMLPASRSICPLCLVLRRKVLREAKEVLVLAAITSNNHSERRFVSGLPETGFVLARDLLIR